ncbi:MAG: glycosyltransferase [Myxococcales bacterium]
MQQPIPILQLVSRFAFGGAERHFLTRIQGHPRGFKPIVGCLHRSGPLLGEVEKLRVPIELFEMRGGFAQFNTAHQILRIAALIEREGVRLVHANDFETNVLAVPAARLAGAKVVCSRFEAAHWAGRSHHFVEAAACRAADVVLTNSRAVRTLLVQEEGLHESRVEVVRAGLDLAAFDRARQSLPAPPIPQLDPGEDGRSRRPSIVVAASLQSAKGHLDLVEAAALVRRQVPDVVFVCAGEGPMRASIEQQIAEAGLHDCVILAGRRADVPALLARAHLACVPSHAEGLSTAIVEAMAAGLPVVATRVGGTTELVAEGPGPAATGVLVPPYKPAQLAEALLGLLRDPPRAQAMGGAARKRAAAELTVEAMGGRIGALYARLLAAGPGGRRAKAA